jgi:type I restriction enzyme, R subunit
VSELKISEAGSVEFPMVAHAAAIGWTAIPPEVAEQTRGGEAGMLFRAELEVVLARFNPWLSPDAIRQLTEKLEEIPPTVEGNREMLYWQPLTHRPNRGGG